MLSARKQERIPHAQKVQKITSLESKTHFEKYLSYASICTAGIPEAQQLSYEGMLLRRSAIQGPPPATKGMLKHMNDTYRKDHYTALGPTYCSAKALVWLYCTPLPTYQYAKSTIASIIPPLLFWSPSMVPLLPCQVVGMKS